MVKSKSELPAGKPMTALLRMFVQVSKIHPNKKCLDAGPLGHRAPRTKGEWNYTYKPRFLRP